MNLIEINQRHAKAIGIITERSINLIMNGLNVVTNSNNKLV